MTSVNLFSRMRLANSGGCLFVALLAFLFVAAAAASEDLSGRWKISYIVQSGGPDEKFAEGSVVSLSEKDSTLQGKATLGSRGDGFLIGSRQGSDVQAAITFRSNPALFLRLSGSQGDDGLQGSFTASGGGSFWQGKFAATQMTTAAGEVIGTEVIFANFTPLDEDLMPKPTLYLDPEANWSAQQDSGVRETFVIRYQRNTVLMCRKKPLIWDWWL